LPLEEWFALGSALDLPLIVAFRKDRLEEPADAEHLGIQELSLRLGRVAGLLRTFELSTRPQNPSYSVDVGLQDDARRLLVLDECWNTFGNINASIRSTRRKIAEAQELAIAIGGEAGAYRVAACWIVRHTRRNREIIARYPEVFGTTFTGSSDAWVKALTGQGDPPDELGLVWCDLKATRLFTWRRRAA
jgi:hypothetical protein